MVAKSHITKLEAMQFIILRTIANTPWDIKNEDLWKYLQISSVLEEIQRFSDRYKDRTANHQNPLTPYIWTILKED